MTTWHRWLVQKFSVPLMPIVGFGRSLWYLPPGYLQLSSPLTGVTVLTNYHLGYVAPPTANGENTYRD